MSAITMKSTGAGGGLKIVIGAILIIMLMVLQVDLLLFSAEKEKAAAPCIDSERRALLHFKAALVDDYGMLSSWSWGTDEDDHNPNCCQWARVTCNNLTGHVQRLHLHGDYDNEQRLYLSREIHTSLIELQQLQYLNLGGNYFGDSHIPEFFGSMSNLRYLDLSFCDFVGKIPSRFGTLSHLKYLNLYLNAFTSPSVFQWVSNVSFNLVELDLSGNLLEGSASKDFGSSMIGELPKLRKLRLSDCNLSDYFLLSVTPSRFNFSTSLSVFDLSRNSFTSFKIFQWVSDISLNLVELDLGENLLEDNKSSHFGSVMDSLVLLDLSSNKLKGGDLKSFVNICTLQSLYVGENNLTEDLPSIVHNFSNGCAIHLLQELDLSQNKIIGTLSDLSIFTSLKTLDLSENRLSEKLLESTKLPPKLESLSIRSNSLEGGIPTLFGNTCTLGSLDLFDNNLSEELRVIIHNLSGCARYSIQNVNLGMNQIQGTLCDFSMFHSLKGLYLFENKLNGKIPEYIRFPSKLEDLDVSSNHLEGVITESHFANMSKLSELDLSGNPVALVFRQNWIPPFQLEYIGLM